MDNQNVQLQESLQNNQPIMPEQKHFANKKFIVTFIILILLGSTAYGAIWYWQKSQTSVVIPTFTPRADETAGWKTYRNDQYGFEFMYPEGFELEEYAGLPLMRKSTASEFYDLVFIKGDVGPDIRIDTAYRSIKSVFLGELINYNLYTQTKTIPESGLNPESRWANVYIKTSSFTIKFSFEKNNESRAVKLFNQILSTFKFTDANAQNGTGTLTGHVDIGPICPVEQVGHPCTPSPETYIAHEFVVFAGQREIARFHADAGGNYRIDLKPGTYTIVTAKTGFGYNSKDLPNLVVIKKGETLILDISIDTGIR